MKTILKLSLAPLLLHALTCQAELTVTNIARGCDTYHSLFIKSDGSLWAMGRNDLGQLGDGSNSNTNRPKQIVASGVTAIAVGTVHSLFLKSDGSLWAMGFNQHGQLGDGTWNNTNQPEQVVAGGVTAIAAGGWTSLFLKSDGSLWAMGYNSDGQLGDGTYSTNSPYYATNQPEQIVASGVTAIAAGSLHSLFLKSDGSLWAMGNNQYGQLGDGTFKSTNRAEQIVASGVTAIAAGENHSLFLKSDGSLWGMGNNLAGQLGDGTLESTNRAEQIVAGGVTTIAAGDHSLFLKSDGSLWAMGYNGWGQLGDGTFGTIPFNYGTNRPELIVSSGVTAIAAGHLQSLFLKSDGSLWAMGSDQYGQLGDGFIDNYSYYGAALPERVLPLPQPVLSSALSSRTNLVINATCGFGGVFHLLASTNITLPLSQWTPLLTNSITTRGTNNFSVTLTNAVRSARQRFYILRSQ